MRRFLFALLLIASFALASGEDDIRSAEKAWAKAVVAKDLKTLDSLLSPELIYAHSTGAIESKTEYTGKIRNGEYDYQGIDHESTTVRMFGDAAVAHSKIRMRGVNKDGPFDHNLIMLHLWVKKAGHWQLAAHQTTRLTGSR